MKVWFKQHRSDFSFRAIVVLISLLTVSALTISSVSALDTGFYSPASAVSNGKGWTNISYSFALDGNYATAKRPNKQLKLSNFTIPSIGTGATIDGIAVTVYGHTTGMQVNVSLYNAGVGYSSAYMTALTGADSLITLGGPTDTWGTTWTTSDFTNANFAVKLTTSGIAGAMIYVDQIQVKVYFTPPPTTLVLAPASGPYNGTTSMTATLTLTADGSPIAGKTVDFYLGGTGVDSNGNCTGSHVGSASSQAGTGVATLASASLSGIAAGDYPYGACASFAGDTSYNATSISSDLTVVGTSTTLVASPVIGTYGETAMLTGTLTFTSGGSPINNEYLNFYLFGNLLGSSKTNISGVATLSNVDLGQYNAGSSEDILITFDGDKNLNPSQGAALITINQRPLTVTAVTDNKVYDATTNSAGVPTITSGTLYTGDTAAFIQTFDTQDVGSNKTLTPSGAVNDGNGGLNYSVTLVPVSTGSISKALLTVTADNQTKPVAQPDPTFTFRYSGLLGSDTATVVDTPPTCGVAGTHTAVGTYTIACSGGADNDYDFSYVNGTLTVIDSGVSVTINGAAMGTYSLSSGTSTRQSYLGTDAGPVRLVSIDGITAMIGSERINLKTMPTYSSYSEFMGVPGSKLSDTYLFPWYNNATAGGLASELRFANVGSSPTTVTVTIAGVVRGTYSLDINGTQRVSYSNVDAGPVQIQSSGGVPIVTSLRVNLKKMPSFTSYTELLGLSASSTPSTAYMFPWYNNASSGGVDSQLRFGNVGGSPTTVTVKIGGVVQGTYDLDPNASARVSFTNIDNGPVEVYSSGGVPIIASERINLKANPNYSSYSELMGQPGVTVTETRYLFPIYTNTTASGLQMQLRFGNVGISPTTVTIKVAGVVRGTYLLDPNASNRVSFDNLDSGPVEVTSSGGVPIIASMRVNMVPNSLYSSNAEMMGLSMGTGIGLPGNQLSTAYWFPWYNDATNGGLDSQLRFGLR